MTPPAEFRILTVCTGNICRSPAAELLLNHHLRDPRIRASSAGTGAQPAMPIDAPMAALLDARGVSPAGFHSTFLTAADIQRADLVLGLTREHRSRVVTLSPGALNRAYTLREFARLIPQVPASELNGETDPVARLQLLTAAARRYRGPVPAGADDVPDPYGRGTAAARNALAAIEVAVATIVAVVGDPKRT